MTMAGETPTIVLVHGAWADATGFDAEIRALHRQGFRAIGFANPLRDLAADATYLAEFLRTLTGPIVLVGHSYGGTLITKAGVHDRVGALVYIAALAPDEDETSQSQQEKFPGTPVFEHLDVADGRLWLLESGVGDFCGDLPAAEQQLVLATGAVPVADLFAQQVPGTAWRTKPSWYIVANEDRTVNPELERAVAERMGAKTYSVDSSHVPMLSHPDFVLDVIRDAAKALEA